MNEFQSVSLASVYQSPMNTRRHFDAAALGELTASILEKGVLVPLLVRRNPTDAGEYEILAGARRYRAANAAQLLELPVRVVDLDDDAALEVIVIENLQREDIHALEEAEGYKRLLARPNQDVAAIADKIGKSESYIYQRLKLTELIEPVKKAFLADEIHAGHALQIARLPEREQREALSMCFEDEWHKGQQRRVLISAKQLAFWIETEVHMDLTKVRFDVADAMLLPKAGACTTCPKRTGFAPSLFPDIASKDACTDRSCFQDKLAAYVRAQKAQLKKDGDDVVEITSRYHAEKGTKALTADRWKAAPATGKNTCDHVRKGIMVDGAELGKVLTVCTNPNCRKHRYGSHPTPSRPAKVSPEEQARRQAEATKQRREAETRKRVISAIVAAAPATLGDVEQIRLLAWAYLREVWSELAKALCTRRAWERQRGEDWRECASREVSTMHTSQESIGVLFELMIARSHMGWQGEGFARRLAVGRIAEQFRIDTDQIAKTVSGEFKAAAMAKKTKRGSKPLHQCEVCGCDELHACDAGCAWDSDFRKQKRWVCTTPACVKAAKKAKKPARAA